MDHKASNAPAARHTARYQGCIHPLERDRKRKTGRERQRKTQKWRHCDIYVQKERDEREGKLNIDGAANEREKEQEGAYLIIGADDNIKRVGEV